MAVLLLLASSAAFAQTQARVTDIRAVVNQAPAAARIHVLCQGSAFYDLQPSALQITDNGLPVQGFSIWSSPSAQTRKPVKAMLALDVSGSMAGAAIDGLKTAAHSIVGFMDPATDSLGIIVFNSAVTMLQGLTNNTARLDSLIDRIGAYGATAVWDAGYTAVAALAALSDTASHAVLLMTDGMDNSSTHTPSEIIALAQGENERVFTIGLGGPINTAQLQAVADLTGGQYYQTPSATQLAAIFLQIASLARRDYDEYTIHYDTPDPGAAQHTLAVSVRVCDTVVTASAARPSSAAATGVDAAASPAGLALRAVAPNPVAGGRLRVGYALGDAADPQPVEIALYDALGRRCATVTAPGGEGEHVAALDLAGLPNGSYRLELRSGREVRTTGVLITR